MSENKNENITIKDIARKFKCSPSTVSRALNNNPTISIETRETIQEYAHRMGYQKNSISLSLLNKSTKTIGVIVPNINHSHETLMIEGIQSIMNPFGYMVIFCLTEESLQIEMEHINRLVAHRVDGIFISISQETSTKKEFKHFEKVKKSNIPLIFIDRETEDISNTSFTIDNYSGAYLATKHLVEIGCKKLAHLRGPENLKVSNERLKGYLQCLKDSNMEINENFIVQAGFDIESAVKPTQLLFKNKNDHPDGIFGVNDDVCFGALQVLNNISVELKQKIAVIGFDNTPISQYFNPSLSTVDRKSFEIGSMAATELLVILSGEAQSQVNKNIFFPTLIKRNSTLIN